VTEFKLTPALRAILELIERQSGQLQVLQITASGAGRLLNRGFIYYCDPARQSAILNGKHWGEAFCPSTIRQILRERLKGSSKPLSARSPSPPGSRAYP